MNFFLVREDVVEGLVWIVGRIGIAVRSHVVEFLNLFICQFDISSSLLIKDAAPKQLAIIEWNVNAYQ